MHAHLAGDMGQDGVPVLELDLEHGVGQGLYHGAFKLDDIFFSQKCFLSRSIRHKRAGRRAAATKDVSKRKRLREGKLCTRA